MSKYDWFTPEGYKPIKEVRSDLIALNLTDDQVNHVIEKFWFRDTHYAFICLNFVYPKFIEYIKIQGDSSFTRLEFYDYFFKNTANKEKLTFFSNIVENLCKNEFTENEINQITENSKITKESLINGNIIKKIDDKYQTVHHTITEYFVAKDILKQPDPVKTFKALSILETPSDITKKERFFNISWYGVAAFLLETEITTDIVDVFINLAKDNASNIEQNFSEILSTIDKKLISSVQINYLFDLILNSAKSSRIWITPWTVQGLTQLYTSDKLPVIENDLHDNPKDLPETMATCNAISILGELFEKNIITDKEKREYFKIKFISYAKISPDTGVLQRRSLSALECFTDDPSIIDKISDNYQQVDSDGVRNQLINEAFFRLCYTIAPNKFNSVDYYLKGLFGSASVYAWQGLKKITDNNSLIHFLTKVSDDDKLLLKIIDGEKIFLSNEDGENNELLDNLGKLSEYFPDKFLELTKKIIIQLSKIDEYYPAFNSSIFIDYLIEKSVEINKNFASELLGFLAADHPDHEYSNYIALLARTINKDNYEYIYERIKDRAGNHINSFFHNIKDDQLKEKIVEKHYGKPQKQAKVESYEDRYLKEFRQKLYPDPKNKNIFIFDVFENYLRIKDRLKDINNKDRSRLWYLAFTKGINIIDPTNFKVKINNYGREKNFNWSRQASFYGDMIRVVKDQKPKTNFAKFRDKFISYIPFTYSDDLTTISEIISSVTEEELKLLNKVFLNKRNDKRYLNPESYIRFVKDMQEGGSPLSSPKKVLISFINDEKIDEWVQISAIEALSTFSNCGDQKLKSLLKDIEQNKTGAISTTATETLIKLFKDKDSTQRRFNQIKGFAKPHKPPKFGENDINTEEELEYLDKKVAEVLSNSKNTDFVDGFISLIKDALKRDGQVPYQEYVRYINEISYKYFEGIASSKNYHLIEIIERAVGKKSLFWNHQLPQLKVSFLTRKDNSA